MHVQVRKQYQSPGRMKNSSYYIAPVGYRTHDLPHTVASNTGQGAPRGNVFLIYFDIETFQTIATLIYISLRDQANKVYGL